MPNETETIRIAPTTTNTHEVKAPPRDNSHGILATARQSNGSALRDHASADDLVVVRGVDMTVADAERMGFLRLNSFGRYEDVTAAQVEKAMPQPEAPEEADMSEALAFDRRTSEAFVNLSRGVEAVGANPAAAISQLLMNPDKLPPAVKLAADHSGIDEAEALAVTRQLAAEVEVAIVDYALEKGIAAEQADAFWSYLKANVPANTLASMTTEALFNGNARPFADLVSRFRISHGSGHNGADVHTVGKGPNQKEVVNVEGIGEVAWTAFGARLSRTA